jgi:4'-phosphopantetheinyl transferase
MDVVWAPGPLHPRLAAEDLHAWSADLEAIDAEQLLSVLSADEQARAERIVSEHGRVLWARARGLLRLLLSRYLEVDPRALQFSSGEHGKPELLAPATAPEAFDGRQERLFFNVSHSRSQALFAFATSGPVGVDLELVRADWPERSANALRVAARIFGPAHARRLEQLPLAPREYEYLRLWTAHEAVLKWRGTGLAGGSDVQPAAILPLDLGTQAVAAVALERPPRELRCWSLQDLHDDRLSGRLAVDDGVESR